VPNAEELGRRLAGPFARAGVRLAVLFRLPREGNASQSDVDLGVLAGGDLETLRAEIIATLGTDRLDRVDLGRASPLPAMQIARHGRVLEAARGRSGLGHQRTPSSCAR
jgi:hypothetical protein